MRKTTASLVGVSALVVSLAFAAPSAGAAAAPPSIKGNLGAIMHVSKNSGGGSVVLPQATTLDLYCYFDKPFGGGRWFYLKVLSGKHKGLLGDVAANDVRNQTSEPKCGG